MMTYWLKIVEKTQTPSFGTIFGGDPLRIFLRVIPSQKLESYFYGAIRWCTFHDPAFALLGTIPAYDRRTDTRTDGHVAVAKTRASIASRG